MADPTRRQPLIGFGDGCLVILDPSRALTPDEADALGLALIRDADRVRRQVSADASEVQP